MKKNLLTLLAVLLIGTTTFAQTPQSFNYQAVLRDASGQVLSNEDVEIGVAILQGSAEGNEVFNETHSVTTNDFGLANLQIGTVNTTEMEMIDWSAGPYFIQISIDGTVMGTSQLLSVPFAMHAVSVENDEVDDADADPTNELQQIAIENNELSISDGNSVDLSSLINLKDTSATNELQTIDFTDKILSISNGNSIDFTSVFNASDTSNTNELQDISLSGTELSISQGSTVDLSVLQDGTGTDNQKLTFYAGSKYLAISNGNSLQLPFIINEQDGDDTNELNTSMVLNGTDLELTDNGGTLVADLSALQSGGNWTLNGDNIYNANSGNVGIGLTNPQHTLTVTVSDTTYPSIEIGKKGSFNHVESGRLIFSEDVNYPDLCGFEIIHNGVLNNLYLTGGCPTPDTIAVFNREGYSLFNRMRVGTTTGGNPTNPFSVLGNSDFTGNMTIDGDLTVTGTLSYSETDPVYASDSLLLKTAANEWNSSIAKTIDAADTTRWAIDADSTNELQSLTISNDTIYLSDGGSVKLPTASPASANISTFGYVYKLATVSDANVAGGADVPLSTNGPLSGVTHTAGTTTITVPATGTYKIDYSLNFTEGVGAAIAIAVNGTVDASTHVPLLVSTGHTSSSVLLTLTAGDVITLRNNSATALTMDLAPSVGAQVNVTFYSN